MLKGCGHNPTITKPSNAKSEIVMIATTFLNILSLNNSIRRSSSYWSRTTVEDIVIYLYLLMCFWHI